jgi:hypothetical protein
MDVALGVAKGPRVRPPASTPDKVDVRPNKRVKTQDDVKVPVRRRELAGSRAKA